MNPQSICERLYKHYGSDASIGEMTGLAQSTINRLRRGVNNPNWATYQILLAELERVECLIERLNSVA